MARFFNLLNSTDPRFESSKIRISCVSWKVFLALRVFFKDESEQNFNPDLEFQPHLLDIVGNTPIFFEHQKQICSIHTTQCHLILTGGRAHTLSPFFSLPHKIYDNLVARGLTFI